MSHEHPKPRGSLGIQVFAGLLWGLVGGFVGKSASLIAQIVLGWHLDAEQFALYALALSFMTAFSGLVNGGTQRVLIQRNSEYDQLAPVVLRLALGFNVIVLAGLASVATPAARWFEAPELTPMLLLLGVATVVSTPGHILHAKLVGELRFKTSQKLAIVSQLSRQGATVGLAVIGFGPLSFALPVPFIAMLDNILAMRSAGRIPKQTVLDKRLALSVLRDARWLMAGTFAAALTQNGSNFVIGAYTDKETLGVYFFAFQLTFAMASLLGGTLQSVTMPALARMNDDISRQYRALSRAVSATLLLSAPAAGLLIFLAPIFFHSAWQGKWDSAVPVVQILAIAIPAVLTTWLARSSLEANGHWAQSTVLAIADGVGTIGAATLGAMSGDLINIAAAVSVFKVAAAALHIVVASHALGARTASSLRALTLVYVAIVFGVTSSLWMIFGGPTAEPSDLRGWTLAGASFVITYACLAMIVFKTELIETRNVALAHLKATKETLASRRARRLKP